MGRLYKSDTKGVYLDLEEIQDHHLKQIVENLYSRWQLLINIMTTHRDLHKHRNLYTDLNNDYFLWQTVLSEVSKEGPAFLTRGLDGSTWATYDDLVAELNRRQLVNDAFVAKVTRGENSND